MNKYPVSCLILIEISSLLIIVLDVKLIEIEFYKMILFKHQNYFLKSFIIESNFFLHSSR